VFIDLLAAFFDNPLQLAGLFRRECAGPAMTAEQKKALFENTARAMGDAPQEIKVHHIGNCMKADPAYGEGVAKALGISIPMMPPS
jgi:catalase